MTIKSCIELHIHMKGPHMTIRDLDSHGSPLIHEWDFGTWSGSMGLGPTVTLFPKSSSVAIPSWDVSLIPTDFQ